MLWIKCNFSPLIPFAAWPNLNPLPSLTVHNQQQCQKPFFGTPWEVFLSNLPPNSYSLRCFFKQKKCICQRTLEIGKWRRCVHRNNHNAMADCTVVSSFLLFVVFYEGRLRATIIKSAVTVQWVHLIALPK